MFVNYMLITVSRKAEFNAAHRLHVDEWSDEENARFFGLCNNPNFHGHNYSVIASVKGICNPQTGILMDMKELKKLLWEEVELAFDHKNFNLDVPEFKNLNPSSENIAWVIWNRLNKRLPENLQLTITLYESERNFVTYSGE